MAEREFCRRCGAPLVPSVPPGDNRLRASCDRCGFIQYDNPRNVVGCLLVSDGKVLLCRRAIEPRHGFWTVPAGFMEQGETLLDGARRESFEEAQAQGDDLQLFAVYSLPHISQVYIMFRGRLRDGHAAAGDETLEVGLFDEADIPWDSLAFPVVTETLQRHFENPGSLRGAVYNAEIVSRPGEPLQIVRHPV